MNLKREISIYFLVLLIFTSGCVERNHNTATASLQADSDLSYDMEEIPVYENLSLQHNEQIHILDANQDYLLINIFEDYTQEDENFREVGYNSESHRLVLFSLDKDRIIESCDISSSTYITDGILTKNGFAFITITLAINQPSVCNLRIHQNSNNEWQIFLGEYPLDGLSDPRLAPLKDGYFAYSYYEESTGSFGVNTVDPSGNITTQLTLTDDGKTEFLRNTMVGNNNNYMFFAAVDSVGTFFIGNEYCISHKFALEANERIYDYCLLDHCCLMTFEIIDDNDNSRKVAELRDFEGKLIFTQENVTYFRLVSDKTDYALGINMGYQSYLIKVSKSKIVSIRIDCPASPVVFYSIGNSNFIVHFYYPMNGGKLGVYTLKVSS